MSTRLSCTSTMMIGIALSMFGSVTTQSTHADVIVEQRLNTSSLVIPTFNTALGTLQSVDLQITLLPGTTSTVGQHSHMPNQSQVTSANTIMADSVSPFAPQTFQTNFGGGHTHPTASPGYSGGGLTIAPFNLTISSDTSHVHDVTITYGGTQTVDQNVFGPDELRVVANIQPTSGSGLHNHSYGSSNQNLSYSGAQVSPFLAVGDIVIPASAFNTIPSSSHTHSLAPFSFPVNTDEGIQLVQFSGINFNSYAMQGHQIDPWFTTRATFTYEPVPEPASVALIGLGMLGVLRRVKRRG